MGERRQAQGDRTSAIHRHSLGLIRSENSVTFMVSGCSPHQSSAPVCQSSAPEPAPPPNSGAPGRQKPVLQR
jgi:hypothetical protein